MRISATDWSGDAGIEPQDAVAIARILRDAGVDIIDVSAGQTSTRARPLYGRMFQTPFSDKIRNEAHVDTIAVGAISEADHVNSIVAAGRADLCAIARPHLADPAWTLPMPGRYLIGQDGTVAYAEVNPDYTRRPEPEDILPALEKLAKVTA